MIQNQYIIKSQFWEKSSKWKEIQTRGDHFNLLCVSQDTRHWGHREA